MAAKLYAQISRTVFILRTNFRAQEDPRLTELLDALQMGTLTDKHKELLNSRVHTPETSTQFRTQLLKTSGSSELSSTIGIATSLNVTTTTYAIQTTLLIIEKSHINHMSL